MKFRITDLEKRYNLELDKITKKIKEKKPKSVLLQFPEGLKPYATTIEDYLKEHTKTDNYLIHLGTCFGACDIPKTKADLIIQFGHAPWTNKTL